MLCILLKWYLWWSCAYLKNVACKKPNVFPSCETPQCFCIMWFMRDQGSNVNVSHQLNSTSSPTRHDLSNKKATIRPVLCVCSLNPGSVDRSFSTSWCFVRSFFSTILVIWRCVLSSTIVADSIAAFPEQGLSLFLKNVRPPFLCFSCLSWLYYTLSVSTSTPWSTSEFSLWGSTMLLAPILVRKTCECLIFA